MQQKNGSSLNGFLWGLIVGVALTLLFTTKKGRQILRSLTDEGLSKFSEVEDILHAMEEAGEYEDVDELTADEIRENTDEKPLPEEEEQVVRKTSHPLKNLTSGSHRFFRKSTKK
ncbi:MAG TPA: YtxH domain-containing protein [Patescibacteria group bacterium]|nr:YtxH domain-containing protein [Patescibacteria group bacterium]